MHICPHEIAAALLAVPYLAYVVAWFRYRRSR